eukprot:CAMPEP_0172518996 /NCGR_PEP_ID=MMETSP1066-20121228/291152_1 /TAXON_ID=671091 /ORGANISM="Coscinodiscus wailesii, Strain CCMP2513" /LENGTH=498 /DNA_ID=CAMNT_0013301493 /DNA_START=432 /DNA_END=1925 /DNA_ORIENTATION=+
MECAVIAEDLCCDAIFVSDAQMNSIQISNTPGTDLNHIFANDYTLTGAKFPTPEIQKFSSGMSCAIFTEDLYCHAIFVSNAKMISIPVSNTEVTELNHIVANSDSSGFGSPWTVPWIPTLAWTRMERSVRAEYLHCLTVFMPNRKMSPINGSNTERSNLDNIFVHGHTGRSSEFIGPRIETSMWPMQARTIIEIYLRCIAILVTNTEMRSVHVFDAEFTDLNCVVSNFYATWGTKVPTPKIVIGAWPGMECAVIAEDLCCDAIFVSDAQMNSIQISNTPGTDLNHIFANDYTLTGAKFPTPEIQKFSSGMSCAIFTEDLYCHAIFVSNAKMISIPVSNTEVTELNHIVANSDSSGFGSPWTVPWIPTLAWTRMERSVRAEYLHCLTVFMPNRKMSPINGSNTERSNLDNIFVHGHTGRSSEFIGPRIETSMWPMQARTIIEIYLRCIAILVTNTEMRSVHVFDAEFTDLNCVVSNFYATWGTKVPTPKIVIGAWPGME